MKINPLASLGIITLLTLSTSGCIIHIGGHDDEYSHHKGDVSHVLGDIDIDADSQMQDLSVVNGDINLENNVSAEDIDTVNGSISLGKRVSIFSASSVNGDIEAGSELTVKNDISTVNGDIELGEYSEVGGDISTVNGDIQLISVTVQGELETKNGDISLVNGTTIKGDLIYRAKEQKRWSNDEVPTLKIDESSSVNGKIILHRKVILEIDDQTLLNKVERLYSSDK
ncbi:hypothetical protein [Flavobacterium sp. W21_SRS_FM6]|uniref:hypothetical protein n=1 Tax=Flavobacterium sp. W21_SRS_FM6 TaxID=3240268 RepID=UPI003F8E5D44